MRDTVIYLLDSSRSHEVPEAHFGPQASGVLEVDRYSGYKAMAQVKSGLIVLAFCWAPVRRDFVSVGKSWSELTPGAVSWLRRIRYLYQVNRERLRHPLGSAKFQEQGALLRRAVETMRAEAVGGRPKTFSRSCPGISLPIAVRRWPCEPRFQPPPIAHDIVHHRLVLSAAPHPTVHRHSSPE